MDSVTRIRIANALRKQQVKVEEIAQEIERDRATVYRWLKGVGRYGIEEYIRRYKRAKKGHRHRKTHSYVEQRVLSIRREHHDCCGEKIQYWLDKEGIFLSRSTIYRILNKHLELRAKGRRNTARGALPQASEPREVIQMDTIDFGEVFAFTAIDIHSREGRVVLRPGLTAQDGEAALKVFMAAFGHCQTIQTDGGSEFEKEFAQLVPEAADHHRVARPYKKNEQAFIERFNRTVRHECLGWENYSPSQILSLQGELESWLDYYHYIRPSMAFEPMHPPLSRESHLI
jgi:IS30 family transposase